MNPNFIALAIVAALVYVGVVICLLLLHLSRIGNALESIARSLKRPEQI